MKKETYVMYEDFGEIKLKNLCKTNYLRKKGKSHIKDGKPCQDYCLVKNINDKMQLICLADGHGHEIYSRSEFGSKIACETFYDLILDLTIENDKNICEYIQTKEFKKLFIELWKSNVIHDFISLKTNEDINEYKIIEKYGTTFMFALYTDEKIMIGQIGDGAIILFDDKDWQLFKRPESKYTSNTASLISSRALYTFHIDSYNSDLYSNVLLSTDGIYDKLDLKNNFYKYALSCTNKIKEQKLSNLFLYDYDGDIFDVSETSTDDCTVALLTSNRITNNYLKKIIMYDINYNDTFFYRRLNNLEIYKEIDDELEFEKHIVHKSFYNDIYEYEVELSNKFNIIFPNNIIKLTNEIISIDYKLTQEYYRLEELIEKDQHTEKKYWFNKSFYDNIDDFDDEYIDSNEYWLKVYETIKEFIDELAELNLMVSENWLESIFVDVFGNICVLSDAIVYSSQKDYTYKFFNYFSIFGKLECGSVTIPLFKPLLIGQQICMLHLLPEKEPLCRIVYYEKKNLFCIHNESNLVWLYGDNLDKEVDVDIYKSLKNFEGDFYLSWEKEFKENGLTLKNPLVKYSIKIFKEN